MEQLEQHGKTIYMQAGVGFLCSSDFETYINLHKSESSGLSNSLGQRSRTGFHGNPPCMKGIIPHSLDCEYPPTWGYLPTFPRCTALFCLRAEFCRRGSSSEPGCGKCCLADQIWATRIYIPVGPMNYLKYGAVRNKLMKTCICLHES